LTALAEEEPVNKPSREMLEFLGTFEDNDLGWTPPQVFMDMTIGLTADTTEEEETNEQ